MNHGLELFPSSSPNYTFAYNNLRPQRQNLKKTFPGPSPAEALVILYREIEQELEREHCALPSLTKVPRGLNGCLQDDVCEVFSPPRILKHTHKLGSRGDLSADLITGWDFKKLEHQADFIFEIERRRPKIIIIEPPCTWFSSLLHANWSKMLHQFRMEGLKASLRLYEFSLRIMELQLRAGRAFVLEHPARATSWQHPRTQHVIEDYPAVSFADIVFFHVWDGLEDPTHADQESYETDDKLLSGEGVLQPCQMRWES